MTSRAFTRLEGMSLISAKMRPWARANAAAKPTGEMEFAPNEMLGLAVCTQEDASSVRAAHGSRVGGAIGSEATPAIAERPVDGIVGGPGVGAEFSIKAGTAAREFAM